MYRVSCPSASCLSLGHYKNLSPPLSSLEPKRGKGSEAAAVLAGRELCKHASHRAKRESIRRSRQKKLIYPFQWGGERRGAGRRRQDNMVSIYYCFITV